MNMKPEILAIIPARGGSKAIPRKNVQLVGGKPLLAYSIEHAKVCQQVSRVVVSTDDEEIAQVAREYGAEVAWRPAEISGDTATSESALVHVLDSLAETEDYRPDLVLFLQCTAPIRHPRDIERALETFETQGADSLVSAMRFHLFIWQENRDGFVEPMDYDPRHRPRRQDRLPEYMENGSFYIFKPWVLREFNSRLGGKMAVHEMDEWCSLDINGPRDLKLAEFFLANYRPED
jgi:N-acylneuraminate cytidylyltransferase